jgi:predicted transcriptional regulator
MVRLFSVLSRRGHRGGLETFFGRLEMRVLETLWRRGCESSVRDLQADFPTTAYTTLMTTLDRLHRKGVLHRAKSGRAFLYQPRYTHEQLRLGLAQNALGAILGSPRSHALLLSFLVDTVSRHDQGVLDDLERLIAEKRREQPGRAR